jgi:exopolysaccharide biosynthesis protein
VPKLRAALVALVFANSVALADWQVTSSNTESAAGVEHRHLELEDSARGEHATLDLAVFSQKRSNLRVIDSASGSESLAKAMARENCVAGVNGGYFDTNFKPLGLRVIDATITSPLMRARLLTGVLCASSRGISLLRVAEFSRKAKVNAAIECGPFLVDGGEPVPKLDPERSARRTFAAATRSEKTALGVSSELTLAELGRILTNRSLAHNLKIWRSLNLDGGSSSAFWFRRNDGSVFSISEEKSVRDFVGIAAR